MVIINLRELYPFYQEDCFVEVADEVAQAMQQFDRQEATYRRKVYRHKAYCSLDRKDGIEDGLLYDSLTPEVIFERKVTCEQLHAAMATLSGKQAKRIYAHFFSGLSKAEIAKMEGVRRDTVSRSVSDGLDKVGVLLKKVWNDTPYLVL